MIIVDNALKRLENEGTPIRVGMIGAGFMARGIAMQIVKTVPGMELVCVSNRSLDGAERLWNQAEVDSPRKIATSEELDEAIREKVSAMTEKPFCHL